MTQKNEITNAEFGSINSVITWLKEDATRYINEIDMRLSLLESKYGLKFNPDQPRVPAGNPDGGQWTDGGGGSGGDMDFPDAIEELHPESILSLIPTVRGLTAIRNVITTSQELTALTDKIGSGHSFIKHVIKQNEFPEISTAEEFSGFIRKIIENPSDMKNLPRGRTAYWDEKTETIVITDPKNPDGGTVFKAWNGKNSFYDLKIK